MIFNKKRRYFKAKYDGVEKMIWDLSFKVHKNREIREEVRQEYDQKKSKFSVLSAQIEAQKGNKTMEDGDVARLDDQKVLLERDIKRHEEQMYELDAEVMGTKPTQENPQGAQGTNNTIDGLRQLQTMLKSYIKGL